MFRPAKMVKVNLLVLEEDLNQLTAHLHEEGLMQLSERPASGSLQKCRMPDMEGRVASLSSKVERIVSLLEQASSERTARAGFLGRLKSLLGPREAPKVHLVQWGSSEEVVQACEQKIQTVSPETEGLSEVLRRSTERRSKLNEHLRLIRDLLPIGVPLISFRQAELTSTFFFYLPQERLEQLSRCCREEIDPVHLSAVSGTTIRLMMAMCLAPDRARLLAQIHRFEGELVELPPYDESPREVEKILLKEMKNLDTEIAEARKRIYSISTEYLDDLRVAAELLSIEREKVEALGLLARTERTVLIDGWVPVSDLEKLEKVVNYSTRGRYFLRHSLPAEEDWRSVPIRLSNPRPFDSFEWVTKMYGMPNYRDVDPTPLMAPTFAIFFGTCLGDAGYGILLTLLSLLVLRRLWGRKMGTALAICGLATVLMGWLTGGWFGNVLYNEDYGPKMSLFKAAWCDPLENPVALLGLALLMGLVHLILGHVTAIIAAARKGRLWQGLVTHLGWCLTLGFGSIYVMWALGMIEPAGWPPWRLTVMYGTVIGLLLGVFGTVWEKSGIARIGGPAQFAYGLLGHMADVISYSRLLALGISSAVNAFLIDMIVFKIAWPSLPAGAGVARIILAAALGILLSIGFVLLHLVNMGLNCLSGFVHTMRLHFAEFFGKFYEAGGNEFTPFKSKRSLTALKSSGDLVS